MGPLLAVRTDEFVAPDVADFWQPIIGDGPWAITRACLLFTLSAVIIAWWLLATWRMTVVPGRMQYFTETVYGLVRNLA